MQPQHEFTVELPIGVADDRGQPHKRAAIRKMRGHEESLLYDRTLGPTALASQLIAGTLLRVGEIAEPGPDLVDRMYSADRNFLLLQIRRITLGDRLTAGYLCPACGEDVSVLEDLGAVPVRELDDDEDPESIEVGLEDGYTDREGNVHSTVVLRLPRGDDELFVASMLDHAPMKAADALTVRCIQRFGTLPATELQAYGVAILRDLTLGDRLRIQRALTDEAPGASLRRTLRCGACGSRFERLLDVSDFFLPC